MGEDVVVLIAPTALDWVVLAPVKQLDRAKSRLSARPAPERRALALAFALDTVRAVLACQDVVRVLVISGDSEVQQAVERLGGTWAADQPALDLNEILLMTSARVRSDRPETAVAALVADLPALRTDELRRALAAAAAVPRGFVADAAGTGTTLLTALPGADLDPHFGPRSRAAHAASGAVSLEAGPMPGLRRDVDTEVDLWDAGRLGLGPTTAALVHGD